MSAGVAEPLVKARVIAVDGPFGSGVDGQFAPRGSTLAAHSDRARQEYCYGRRAEWSNALYQIRPGV